MALYLSSILNGNVDIPAVKDWLAGCQTLPPPALSVTSPGSPASETCWPNFTADQFQVILLNYVKEEADVAFLALEKHASDVHAKLEVKGVRNARDAKTRHAGQLSATTPLGVVDDSSFPALSFQSDKVTWCHRLQT